MCRILNPLCENEMITCFFCKQQYKACDIEIKEICTHEGLIESSVCKYCIKKYTGN